RPPVDELDELVQVLERRVPITALGETLQAPVERFFAETNGELRKRRLCYLYASLERAIVNGSNEGERQRDHLRALVRKKFPRVAERELKVVFADAELQERLLCRDLLLEVLSSAADLLGEDHRSFAAIHAWLERFPDAVSWPAPFRVAHQEPRDHSQWLLLFQRMSSALFETLSETLGEATSARLLRRAYRVQCSCYGPLERFPVVVALMPDALLDHRVLDDLSESQMRRVL